VSSAAVAGVELLVPHLSGVIVEAVETSATRVRIVASNAAGAASCPRCGRASSSVHSRYTRVLSDLAISGRRVEIKLRVRRWRCLDEDCPARTFVEQVDGLTVRHARRTIPLRQALEQVALSLAGRAGARLCGRLAIPASRSSLLRLLRALPGSAAYSGHGGGRG
jgi:transposase